MGIYRFTAGSVDHFKIYTYHKTIKPSKFGKRQALVAHDQRHPRLRRGGLFQGAIRATLQGLRTRRDLAAKALLGALFFGAPGTRC